MSPLLRPSSPQSGAPSPTTWGTCASSPRSGEGVPAEGGGKGLKLYIDFLTRYTKANVISNQMTRDGAEQLVRESLLLGKIIEQNSPPDKEGKGEICDAGSGNGILGIPLAIAHPDWNVTLVEPKTKKLAFLREAVTMLGLQNVAVFPASTQEYFDQTKARGVTLIARGYPDNAQLVRFLENGSASELLLVTAEKKIPATDFKTAKHPLPGRDLLLIAVMKAPIITL